MIIAPFLRDSGPAIEVDEAAGTIAVLKDVRADPDPFARAPVLAQGTVVFRWDPEDYFPSGSVNFSARRRHHGPRGRTGNLTARARAADILSFCTAYVERPGEFDRERSAPVVPPAQGPYPEHGTRLERSEWKRRHKLHTEALEALGAGYFAGGANQEMHAEQFHADWWRIFGAHFCAEVADQGYAPSSEDPC